MAKKPNRYFFFDFETTGVRTRFDHAVQIAALVVDEDFRPVPGGRFSMRCRPRRWSIPSPMSLFVTHTDPMILSAQPSSYYGLMREFYFFIRKWSPAVFIGYNTLGFDEEMLRQGLWENLFDPYMTSKNGNLRADLLRIVQTAVCADPDVLTFPLRDDGKPSHKLDRLATANGFENHDAHDAMGDVLATIHLAKTVKERAPEVWGRMIANADPAEAAKLLKDKTVLLATHFGEPDVRLLAPVTADPNAGKQIACFDLAYDPEPYAAMTPSEMAEAMKTDYRTLRVVKGNSMPTILSVEEPCGMTVPGIDSETLARRLAAVSTPEFRSLYAEALALRKEGFADSPWLEQTIYDGFASREDEKTFRLFQNVKGWAARWAVAQDIREPRFKALAERILFDSCPNVLSAERQAQLREELVGRRLSCVFPTEKEDGKPFKAPFLTASEALRELESVSEGALGDSIRKFWAPLLAEFGPKEDQTGEADGLEGAVEASSIQEARETTLDLESAEAVGF